jgi:hypothetical protein
LATNTDTCAALDRWPWERTSVKPVGATLDVRSALTIGEERADASLVTNTTSRSPDAGVIVPEAFGVFPVSGVVTRCVTVANGHLAYT